MITLSNKDAETLYRYANERHSSMHGSLDHKSSTRSINEVRRMGILLKKVDRKLSCKKSKGNGN